ncbi:hypothetical protein H4S07_000039 [Coemansia furcata]|uniref:Uncharacterized protein n=1 Tax=Coemansia furcata TaxID=417177 RepID=A0ACC1LRX4_9FUNG|nr:hypothetical protein H4S07_000039 [Coemansia furcata]
MTMKPTTERPDTVYYDATSSVEAPVAKVHDELVSSIEEKPATEKRKEEVSSEEKPATEQPKEVVASGEESPATEKPAPLSRVSSFLAKVKSSVAGLGVLSRKYTWRDDEEEEEVEGEPLPDLSCGKDEADSVSLGEKDDSITERLVPLLDTGLIENWDQRTGAIVTFDNGSEGFKLLPKGVAEIEDHLFSGVSFKSYMISTE